MSFVPLYARVCDNQGYCRSTSSCRGSVDNVSIWLNSWFGEVLNISAQLINGRNIVPKLDLRKVKKELREQARKEYEEEVSRENKVIIDIDIPAKKEFVIKINGLPISYERLKMMENLKFKKLDMQLEVLKKLHEKDTKILQVAKAIIQ